MWGLIAFLIGIIYGWAKPGRQPKMQLLKTGVLIGVLVALIMVLIGYFAGVSPLGIGTGALSLILSAILISVLFVLGVWLGDIFEGRKQQRRVA